MNFVTGLVGLVLGAVGAWELSQSFAAAEMKHLRARTEERVRYWKAEAGRAKAAAAQAEQLVAAWREGCQQGREETLTLARSLSDQSG